MDRIINKQKIFFISDLHLGHKRIIGYCNRPFITGEEMDEKIISAINSKVSSEDILYIIGDFCHKGGDVIEYRKKINSNYVHIILGNHDNINKFDNSFASISYQKMILYKNQKIFMSHYPMRSWPCSHRKSWMIYGHVHGRLHNEDIDSGRFTLDVGVDNKRRGIDFGTPWSFKDIQQQFLSRKRNFSSLPIDSADTLE